MPVHIFRHYTAAGANGTKHWCIRDLGGSSEVAFWGAGATRFQTRVIRTSMWDKIREQESTDGYSYQGDVQLDTSSKAVSVWGSGASIAVSPPVPQSAPKPAPKAAPKRAPAPVPDPVDTALLHWRVEGQGLASARLGPGWFQVLQSDMRLKAEAVFDSVHSRVSVQSPNGGLFALDLSDGAGSVEPEDGLDAVLLLMRVGILFPLVKLADSEGNEIDPSDLSDANGALRTFQQQTRKDAGKRFGIGLSLLDSAVFVPLG